DDLHEPTPEQVHVQLRAEDVVHTDGEGEQVRLELERRPDLPLEHLDAAVPPDREVGVVDGAVVIREASCEPVGPAPWGPVAPVEVSDTLGQAVADGAVPQHVLPGVCRFHEKTVRRPEYGTGGSLLGQPV